MSEGPAEPGPEIEPEFEIEPTDARRDQHDILRPPPPGDAFDDSEDTAIFLRPPPLPAEMDSRRGLGDGWRPPGPQALPAGVVPVGKANGGSGDAAHDWRFADAAPRSQVSSGAPSPAPQGSGSRAAALLFGALAAVVLAALAYVYVGHLQRGVRPVDPAPVPRAVVPPPPAAEPLPAPDPEPGLPSTGKSVAASAAQGAQADEASSRRETRREGREPAAPATPGTPGPTARKRGAPAAKEASAEPTALLPEAPSRAQVIEAVGAVRPQIAACAAGRRGVAQLDLTVANTGRVIHALVVGDFAGTPQGSCIAQALRKARFPRFEQARFRVLYPLSL